MVDFLNVGQGDGAVLRTPHGRFVVIDAGPRTDRGDAGQRVVVPVDHEKLKEIADGTGGSYYAAASAEQLSSVYRDLGSQIGYTTERREITTWFVGIGLLFAFGAAGLSLLWSNRLL